jgi:4-aminobutyrate aminotransferase-like enzyme
VWAVQRPKILVRNEKKLSLTFDQMPLVTEIVDYDEILHVRKACEGPNVTLAYNKPVHFIKASGCTLVDSYENEWLDCVNNVAHVGHCDRTVCFSHIRNTSTERQALTV